MPKRVNAPSTRSGCGTKKAAPNEPQANGWVIDERHAARGAPHVLPQRFAAVDRTRASHSNNRAYAGSHSWHQLRCGHVRILPQRAHGGSSAICTAHDSGGSEGARAVARSCAWRSSLVMVHRRVIVDARRWPLADCVRPAGSNSPSARSQRNAAPLSAQPIPRCQSQRTG